MSRYPEGRRGRGRKSDPAEETATWLLEMEQQAQVDEGDEDWAQPLRSTRASTGQFPAVPAEGPGGAAPPPGRAAPAPTGQQPAAYPPVSQYPNSDWAPEPAYQPPDQYPAGEQAAAYPPLGQQPTGEQAAVHPPLAERYRSASRMPIPPASPPPPAAPAPPRGATTDPGAAAWSWDQQAPPADQGFKTGARAYETPSGAWEPGIQSQPQSQSQAPLDPRLGAPAPWQVEDPAYGAAPPLEPQPWDTAAGSEQWSANWPFEETTQSWEANDESWRWPTQEVPTSTGSWDVDSSAWREEPWESGRGQPRGETGDQGYGYPRQSAAPEAPGGSTANGYPAAYDAPVPNGYPAADAFAAANGFPAANGYPGLEDLSAYGGTDPGASTGPMAPGPLDAGAAASAYGSPGLGARDIAPPASEAWTADAQRAWYGEDAPRAYESPSSEFAGVLEGDEEQVVRLGRSADDPNGRGLGPMDGSRVNPARSTRTAEARRFQPAGEHRPARSSWPRVVALISWIVLLMVVCWFYVFPWLEQILPENF